MSSVTADDLFAKKISLDALKLEIKNKLDEPKWRRLLAEGHNEAIANTAMLYLLIDSLIDERTRLTDRILRLEWNAGLYIGAIPAQYKIRQGL